MKRTLHYDFMMGEDTIRHFMDSYKQDGGQTYDKVKEGLSPSFRRLFLTLFGFDASGRQVIELGPALSESFGQMSIDNVTPDLLALPYPCFYLQLFDEPPFLFEQGGKKNTVVALDGFYVLDTPEGWMFTYTSMNANGTSHDESEEMCNTSDVFPFHDWLKAGQSFKELTDDFLSSDDVDADGVFAHAIKRLVNTLLYLRSESVELEIEESKQRKRLTKRIDKATTDREKRKLQNKLDRITCIRRTKLAPEVEKVAKAAKAADACHTPKERHWVRGHWKRVRHGPGRSLTKIVQVWPYLRGEGEDPQGLHTYKLEEPKEHTP